MTTDRREFLKTLGGAALGGAALGIAACRSVGAALPAAAMTRRIPRIGLQLYTVRDAMKADVAGTIARVAKVGYKEVEFAGYFGRSPAEIRQIVADNGLTAPSSHVAIVESMDAYGKLVDDAKTAGHEWVVMPYLPEERRTSFADYVHLSEMLNMAAHRAHDAGLRFAYHNHDFEFRSFPDAPMLPYDYLLQHTDPSLVHFEMDLYWITKAGHDPIAYFDRYPGRFAMVHVKDATAAPAREMAPVGRGTIDFKRIFAHDADRGAHIQHYFVEHDNAADPFASIATSYATLSALRF